MRLIPYADWSSRPRGATSSSHPIGSTEGVTLHWEGPRMGAFSHDRCAGKVRGIQDFHRDSRGWADIAYNAVVCPHGYVFEGRGPGVRSAANGNSEDNDDWYAVCYLGGEGDGFTDAGKAGFVDAVTWLRERGDAGPRVNGHRDHKATACPGDEIYRWLHARDWSKEPDEPQPEGLAAFGLKVAVTNIPRKVGEKAWRRCFELMADRAHIFGANEIGSDRAKNVMLDLVREHGLRQYGTRIGPNPIFWSPRLYKRVSARQIRLHGPATGRLARKYPGYNSARYVTEVVLRQRNGGPEVAVLNAHLVPNGRKVNPVWRARMRARSLRTIRDLVREHRAAGRLVVLMGDTNIRTPFFVVRGWRWLRGTGIDKVGILAPRGYVLRAKSATTYPAPTDHKHGIRATAKFSRKESR